MGFEDGPDDEEEDAHAETRYLERTFTPKGLDEEEDEKGCRDDFDNTVDPRGEKGVRVTCVSDLPHGRV